MIIKDKLTYVSGYWKIRNNKRPVSDYYQLSISTFQRLLKEKVTFYSDDDEFIARVKNLNPTGEWTFITCSIDKLAFHDSANTFVNGHRFDYASKLGKYEKHNLHYIRDWKQDPFVYAQLLTVWLNKIILMHQTVQFAASSMICWIDPTFSRFDKVRKNNLDRYNILPDSINMPKSYLNYQKKQIGGNASIIATSAHTLKSIIPIYAKFVKESFQKDYLFDEEVLIEKIKRSDLINLNIIDRSRFGQLKYMIRGIT